MYEELNGGGEIACRLPIAAPTGGGNSNATKNAVHPPLAGRFICARYAESPFGSVWSASSGLFRTRTFQICMRK